LRGNTINSIKAQKLFFEKKSDDAQGAFQRLNEKQAEFENETVQKAQQNQ
jgi:hypothetical protein